MDNLEVKLTELTGTITQFRDKAQEELKSMGEVNRSTKTKLTELQTQYDALDKRISDNLAASIAAQPDTFDEELKNDESLQRLMRDRKGRAVINLKGKSAVAPFERKTTIEVGTVGTATTGVLQIGRLPGITTEPQQMLTIRDLLPARPTTFQVIDYVRVSTPMSIASPVPEASTKPENQLNFNSLSERVKVIATFIPASRQILDDMPELLGFIRTVMPYYVNLAEEQQLLSGDNVNEDLHGLIPQASAFSTGLLSNTKGWNKIDIIGRAIEQITSAKEMPPSWITVNPNDYWDMRLTKDGFGRYIMGDPQDGSYTNTTFGGTAPTVRLFGLVINATTSIAPGTFLVGSGSPIAAEIRDRMEMQIDISTEHSTFFTQNLVAIRAEKRLALIVRRPGSFITGSFTTSPV